MWLAQPYVLGPAIDGLLQASYAGLLMFTCQQFMQFAIGVLRRIYDTRMFSRIHADIVSRLVREQRQQNVAVSRIVARSALSCEFVDFFERHVPVAIQTVFLLVGGLTILASYDRAMVVLCITLLVPAAFINASFARKMLVKPGATRRPGDRARSHRAWSRRRNPRPLPGGCELAKSLDCEAGSFGLIELFVLGAMAAALVRLLVLDGLARGDLIHSQVCHDVRGRIGWRVDPCPTSHSPQGYRAAMQPRALIKAGSCGPERSGLLLAVTAARRSLRGGGRHLRQAARGRPAGTG